jgi:leucyl-tRNA synthetase
MSFLNELERREAQWRGTPLWHDVLSMFIRLCAPIAPFLAEEVWAKFGHQSSIHLAPWPRYDPELAKGRDMTVVIEVDGRVRETVSVEAEVDQEALIRMAAARESVRRAIGGRTVQRVIVVPGRLVNFVTLSSP